MTTRSKTKLAALGAFGLLPVAALAQTDCAALANWLEAQPGVTRVTAATPVTTLTAAGSGARCEANFIYSSRGGPKYGYDAGENQRLTIRVGLPLNGIDNGSGGIPGFGAWNGRTRALGGGGCAGSVGAVTAATGARYVGSSTDTGHVGGDCLFALQPTPTRLNVGRLNDFIADSLLAQVRWSKVLATVYFGAPPARNYWDGCSTGGRQGMALAQRYPEELDGWLVGAPAVNYGRFRMAQLWGPVVMKDLVGAPISAAKTAQATASAVAACDAADGVVDGILQEPRHCTFSATANVCGAPTAPASNCLTPQEAAAIDLIWDGPRNAYGRKIFPGLTRGGQISALSGTAPSATATGQVRWNHSDASFDWQTVTMQTFGAEAELGSLTNGDIINTRSIDLDRVRDAGKKILMWHGTADQLITDQNSVDYYMRVATRYGNGRTDYDALQPWFRYFRAPGVAHCGGGNGPQPPEDMFETMVNWVENGVAPDTLIASGGGRTRPLCPFPKTAIYSGAGDPDVASNWSCGGNVQTPAAMCALVKTLYKSENGPITDTLELGVDPRLCQKR